MRIWLVTVGEPLPTDPGNKRLLRVGMLADILWRRGHEVVWWTSAFDHHRKRFRVEESSVLVFRKNFEIQFLKGCGYSRNISFARLRDHRSLAVQFRIRAAGLVRPDVILASYPTVELANEVTRFGQQEDIPVILDVRDLWPDVIVEHLPRGPLRWLGRQALRPMDATARHAFGSAHSVTGITEEIVSWALGKGSRERTENEKSFPLAYPEPEVTEQEVDEAGRFWDGLGVSRERFEMIVCFFGTLGRQFDLETVISALSGATWKERIAIVICGAGDRLEYYRKMAAGLENCFFPGWVDVPQIVSLMERSSAGIAPYIERYDFLMSIPNKPLEYFSGSLPVISSLESGPLARILRKHECGLIYESGERESFEKALFELYHNHAKCRRMGRNAREVYKKYFRADVVYEAMADYVEGIARRGDSMNGVTNG